MQRLTNRLQTLIEKQKQDIEANPWPTIERLQNEIFYLMELLLQVNVTVNPVEIHLESSYPIQPADIRQDAVQIVEEVRELLKGL